MLRSLLFVPGDSQRKLAAAAGVEASALILDLEDSVAGNRKSVARTAVADYLLGHRDQSGPAVWVRINSLQTDEAVSDLAAIVPAKPAGIVLPKCDSPERLRELANNLDKLEASAGLPRGQIGIIPVVTESARGVFQLGAYQPELPRLRGMTWGAEDLSVDIGASGSRDETGELLPVFLQVQNMVVLAAAVAEVQAIDTIYAKFEDLDGLTKMIARSRRQGFSGMLAIHPSQVPLINSAFAPTRNEIEHARRVVQAFADANGAGAIRLDGKMLDQPHLAAAQRVLDNS